MTKQIGELISEILPEIVALRHDLHAHPEGPRVEHRTSARVREVLSGVPGLDVSEPLTGTDVVAVLNGDRAGRCIALRADLDALPIEEQTDVPYRSQNPGFMHACGHDGHTSTLVGTAMVLSRIADTLPGCVKFIFQPDEEDQGGARLLCEAGVLKSPDVDAIFALHAWPTVPVGSIALTHGSAMAANCTFHIEVEGTGGHGAYPHRCTDTVVIASQIVLGIQTIVSRTVDPLDSAVVTVGSIHAGAADNVIPSKCHLTGTVRYLRAEVGGHLRARLRQVAEATAAAHGAKAHVQIQEGYPPVFNDPGLMDLVESIGRDLLGQDSVYRDLPPSMGVEDFAFYGQHVPAAMFRLGVRPSERDSYPHLHSPGFNFNDDAIPVGIRLFCEIVRRFLQEGRQV